MGGPQSGKQMVLLIDVAGDDENDYCMEFSPQAFWTAAGKPELAELPLEPNELLPVFAIVVSSIVSAEEA